jgi:hypothetical protein
VVWFVCGVLAIVAVAIVVDVRDRSRVRRQQRAHRLVRARLWDHTQALALKKATIVFPVGWVAPDRKVPINKLKQPT